jgi:hypothetical protein
MSRPSGHGSSTNGRGERGLSPERVGHAGDNPRPTGGNTPQLDILDTRTPGQDRLDYDPIDSLPFRAYLRDRGLKPEGRGKCSVE